MNKLKSKGLRTVALSLAAATALLPAAAGAYDPTPHHAVYTLSLDSAKAGSSVVSADGTLDYRWQEFCGSWTVEQNYTLTIQYAQGNSQKLHQEFATTESKDGTTYRFNQRGWTNGQEDTDLRGTAEIHADGGTAHFIKPDVKSFHLPAGALFPTAHTLTLIRQAEAGKRFFAAHVFDGASFDGTSSISAVIGPENAASHVSDSAATAPNVNSPLLKHAFWQTWLSFYSDATKDTEADYQLGQRLYDNGVSSNMILNYGNYTVAAQLISIEPLPKPSC